ncbi:MAG: hypothetical protein GY791_06540 [Alphaproteobacteria bacterium]|nr:hypothetical protein [Alphaproteobacteria bacterium]
MMTLERFKSLAAAYGAEIGRWPGESQDEARRLIAHSAEARAVVSAEADLDRLLATWQIVEPSPDVARRVREAARISPQHGGAPKSQNKGLGHWLWPQLASAAAAAVLGFALGWSGLWSADSSMAEPIDLSAYVVGVDVEEDMNNDS